MERSDKSCEPRDRSRVGLSAAQQSRIREIAAAAAREAEYSLRGIRKHERKFQEQQLREKVNQQILAVLTAQQRAQWQRMLGAPFRFEE